MVDFGEDRLMMFHQTKVLLPDVQQNEYDLTPTIRNNPAVLTLSNVLYSLLPFLAEKQTDRVWRSLESEDCFLGKDKTPKGSQWGTASLSEGCYQSRCSYTVRGSTRGFYASQCFWSILLAYNLTMDPPQKIRPSHR